MFRSFLLMLAVSGILAACNERMPRDNSARILAMGDSMMAWNDTARANIPDSVEQLIGEPVVDRSVIGSRIVYPLPISGAMGMKIEKQYRPGQWDWVIMNGGGNDLWFGCGCRRCDARMAQMVSKDGRSGAVPDLVRKVRSGGAKVIYLGYLRSPGVGSMIEHCRNDGNEYETRLAAMANADSGVYFVSLRDLVPYGDRSYHSFDMIHPSVKGSRKIAQRVAEIIR